jgi:hypothetical protein
LPRISRQLLIGDVVQAWSAGADAADAAADADADAAAAAAVCCEMRGGSMLVHHQPRMQVGSKPL